MTTIALVSLLLLAALSAVSLLRAYRHAPEGRQDESGFTPSRKATFSSRVEAPLPRFSEHHSHHGVA